MGTPWCSAPRLRCAIPPQPPPIDTWRHNHDANDSAKTITIVITLTPARHREAAALLGGDVAGAQPEDAGDVLAARLVHLMKLAGTPSGLGELGFCLDDLETLVQGTICQKRVVNITPREVTEDVLRGVFTEAIEGYW